MKQFIVGLLFLTPFTASAGFSVATGVEIGYAEGQQYTEIRYQHDLHKFDGGNIFGISGYVGSMNTKGIGMYVIDTPVLYGIGVETADRDEDVVATKKGYEIRLEWFITEQLSLGLKHRSNCSVLCRNVPVLNGFPKGPEDENNHGFNFLILRYDF